METKYLNTDLVVDSDKDLQALVDDFGDKVIILFHGPFNSARRCVFELTFDASVNPEEVIDGYCSLIDNLSPKARKVWDDCSRRVMDIGIEAGDSPRPYMLELSSSTLHRISSLGASLILSVYPTVAE